MRTGIHRARWKSELVPLAGAAAGCRRSVREDGIGEAALRIALLGAALVPLVAMALTLLGSGAGAGAWLEAVLTVPALIVAGELGLIACAPVVAPVVVLHVLVARRLRPARAA